MMITSKNKLFVFVLFLALLSACDTPHSIKVSNLKILYNQAATIDLLKDNKDWQEINDLSKIKIPVNPDGDLNHVWLKGEFNIDNHPESLYGLYFANTKSNDSVYINNKLVGNKNAYNLIELHTPSHYKIPKGILVKGKNEVHIRLEALKKNYLGIKSDILIQSKAEFGKTETRDNILYKDILYGILSMLTAYMLLDIIYYIIDRKYKLRLLMSVCLLFTIALTLMLFIPFKFVSIMLLFGIKGASFPLLILLNIILIQTMFGVYLLKYNKIMLPVMFFLALLIIVSINFPQISFISPIFIFVSIIIGFATIGCLVYKLNSIRPDKFKLYFIYSVFIMILTNVIWVTLEFFTGLYCPDLLSAYLLPVYFIIFSIYHAKDAKEKRKLFDHLYDRLRELKPAKPVRLKITESSEEKLAKVIDFINENYSSDISREGLAATIDINPNYLSSLFNAYTGKKIKEYINFMRIKEAAKQLEETNEKIVNIAFSVGFENISTFIRSFKTETGKTPSEYRDGIKKIS
jgi:AraC-like DNA-binding protein